MKLKKNLFTMLFLASLLNLQAFASDDEPGQGQVAPDFSITQLDGSEFKLSDYRGKQSVYLVFWNTWCTYCMKKIPKLKQAQANLSDHIKIIAINTSLKDTLNKTINFQKQFAINYPLAFDHGKKITDLYGVWGTPTEFIIDINGIIQHRDGVPDELVTQLSEWNKPAEMVSHTNLDNCQLSGKVTC